MFSASSMFDPLLELAASAIAPHVERAIASTSGTTDYHPYEDYIKGVARTDVGLGVNPGTPIEDVLKQVIVAGWIPVYCSDSQLTRDAILQEFAKRGWQGKGWWQSYSSGMNSQTNWYGATFKLADAPPAIVQAAYRIGCQNPDAFADEVAKFLVDAKHHMRQYGGSSDYDQLILRAVPVLSNGCQARGLSPSDLAPWYTKWWVWALIVGIPGTVIGLGYVAGRRKRSARE